MSGHLLRLHKTYGSLTFRLTPDGKEESNWVFEHNDIATNKHREQFMIEALEEYVCNGWDYIDPQLLLLPDNWIILSDDTSFDDHGNITRLGNIYTHPYGFAAMFSRLWSTGQLDLMRYPESLPVITQDQAAARRWRKF